MNETTHPKTIVVIDDEEIIRQSLCDQLEDLGYRVLTAEDGRAGIELIEQERPELILTDLRMPEMGGLEVIKRSKELASDTPIIVISGAGGIDDAVEALRRGAYDYLTKPVNDRDVLQHSVSRALENASLQREVRAYQEHLEELVRERTEELELAQFVLDNAGDAALGLNQDGRVVYANNTSCDMLGYSHEEILTLSVPDFDPNTSLEDFTQAWKRGKKTEPYVFEGTYLTKAGKIISIEASLCSVEFGGEERVIIFSRDITERKRAEERFRDMAESASDWFWEMGPDLRFTYHSERYFEITGFRPEEKIGTTRTRYVDPTDREADAEKWAAHLADLETHKPFKNFEYAFASSTGRVCHARISGTPNFDSDGEFLGYRGTGTDITEQKRTERLFIEQKNLLQAVVDAVPAIISVKDRDLLFLMVNQMQAEELGCTPEEAIGKRRDAFPRRGISSEEGQRYTDVQIDREHEVLRTGEARLFYEESFTYENGEVEHRLVNKIPLHDADGQIYAILTVAMDITERKQAEEALRESRDQIRLINNNLPVAIAYFDAEQRYRFANRMLEVWYDRPAEEILGHTIGDILGQEAQKAVVPHVAAALRGKEEHYEQVVAYPDGKTRTTEVTFVPHIDDSGTVRGCFALVQDVTERKRAEEALRESEARLKRAQEIAHIGTFVWDEVKDEALYRSDVIADIYGLPPERVPRSFEETLRIIHPDDRDKAREAFTAASRARRAYDVEYRIVRPDGKIRHVHELSDPEFDENGTLVRSIGTTQDITEQKQAEEQLRQAQKMEAIGQLTGGVAHDFNNILAVILLNADFMRDGLEKGSSAAESLDSMTRVANRGAELTHRLLAFSRQQTLESKVTDANGLITGMTGMLRRTLGETVEIETSLADDLWRTLVDPNQLENALLNLAINARDAMPKGGKLTIETANIELDDDYAATQGDVAPGDYVRLSVSDSGTGMAPEVVARVFEPFYTTKDVGKGTGLGLSMVYGFVKQSGGHITIYSEEGRGTTVHLYLPQTEAAAQAAEALATVEEPTGRGETVLVVEDDAVICRLVAKILSHLGYQVLEAGDGAQALATLERAPEVDLLLSDVVLPGGKSGPEIVAQAQRHRPGLKSLFMTGYAPGGMSHQGRLPEGAALLNKPFTKRDLAQRVRAVLDG